MGVLEDRVVVVSGVGPGLGAAIALQSARAGASVVLSARTEKRLEKVAAAVHEIGGTATVIPADITDDDSVRTLVDHTLDAYGRVDALVNNAFVMPPIEPVSEAEFDVVAPVSRPTCWGRCGCRRRSCPCSSRRWGRS